MRFNFLFLFVLLVSCNEKDAMLSDVPTMEMEDMQDLASIEAVEVSGASPQYIFKVTVKSPDTGCDQYADWWEVITPDEELIYRRILTHSHVNEQPFTRQGNPVPVNAEDVLIVRLHMNNSGYARNAMQGSVQDGFDKVVLEEGFGQALEDLAPQPPKCTN